MVTYNNAINLYGTNRLIVSSIAGQGNFTTIAAALSAASAGDTIFIRSGTYTENLSLVAGVNLTTDSTDAISNTVEIVGTLTCNYTGSVSISGISLKPGVAASINSTAGTPVLNLINCNFNCANVTYALTANNNAFIIKASGCTAQAASATNSLFNWTAINYCRFSACDFGNLGYAVTQQCQAYSNKTEFFNCFNSFPLKCNGTGYVIVNNTTLDTSSANAVCVTINNSTTGVSQINNSILYSGTNYGARVGSSVTVYINFCMFYNSNATDIFT